MSSVRVHKATRADLRLINLFYNRIYHTYRSENYWEHTYFNNPMGEGVLFVASVGDDIVGTQGLIPYTFVSGKKNITTYKSEDTLVDTRHRGKGIFRLLYDHCHTHAAGNLIWGYTNQKEAFAKVGMSTVENLSIREKVLSLSAVANAKSIQKKLYYLLLFFKTRVSTSKRTVELRELSNSTVAESYIGDMTPTQQSIQVPLSKSYFDWRFNNTTSKVVFLGTTKGEDFLLLDLKDRQAHLLHWFWKYDNKETRKQTLDSVLVWLKEKKCELLQVWSSPSQLEYEKTLSYALTSSYRKGQGIVVNKNLTEVLPFRGLLSIS